MGQRSLKIIEISAIRKLGCGFLFAFYSKNMAVSVAVCEIFSVKGWRDLENQVRVVQGHWKLRRLTDHVRLSIGPPL